MTTTLAERPVIILMAEDNLTDVLIAREGFASAKMLNTLHVVDDGIEAMEFLRQGGKYAEAPRPDLILLDLNMPRKNGQEVLTEIKTDDVLKSIPVISFTTSKSSEDIDKAYGLHANCYTSASRWISMNSRRSCRRFRTSGSRWSPFLGTPNERHGKDSSSARRRQSQRRADRGG